MTPAERVANRLVTLALANDAESAVNELRGLSRRELIGAAGALAGGFSAFIEAAAEQDGISAEALWQSCMLARASD